MMRCRERLRLSNNEIESASYREQLEWISYELLRQAEEMTLAQETGNKGMGVGRE